MLKIRAASPVDREEVIAIWQACDLVKPQNDPVLDFDLALQTQTSTVLLLEVASEVIGTVMVGFDGHRGWFYYLGIKPEHQNSGNGSALVAAAEDWLEAQGAPKAMLMVRHSNKKVIDFYKRIGYNVEEAFVLGKRF